MLWLLLLETIASRQQIHQPTFREDKDLCERFWYQLDLGSNSKDKLFDFGQIT